MANISEPTKEYALSFVIAHYGAVSKKSIELTINVLNYECKHLFNVNKVEDQKSIELNMNIIGFLYSALRTMEYRSSDTPLFLN